MGKNSGKTPSKKRKFTKKSKPKKTGEGYSVPENGNGNPSGDSVQQTTKSDNEKKIDSSGKLKFAKKQTEEEDSAQENGKGKSSTDSIQQTMKSADEKKQIEELDSVPENGNGNTSADSVQQTTKSDNEKKIDSCGKLKLAGKHTEKEDSVQEDGKGNSSTDSIQQTMKSADEEKQAEEEDSIAETRNGNNSKDSIQQTTKSSYKKKQTEKVDSVTENGNGNDSADSVQQTTKSDDEKKIDSSEKLKLAGKETEEEHSVTENTNDNILADSIPQATNSNDEMIIDCSEKLKCAEKQTDEGQFVPDNRNGNNSTDSIPQISPYDDESKSYSSEKIKLSKEEDFVKEVRNGKNSTDSNQETLKTGNENKIDSSEKLKLDEKQTEEGDSVPENRNRKNSAYSIQGTTKPDNEKEIDSGRAEEHTEEGNSLPETENRNSSTDSIQQTIKFDDEKKIESSEKLKLAEKQTGKEYYVPENGKGNNSTDSLQKTAKSDDEKRIDSNEKLKLAGKHTEEGDSAQEDGKEKSSTDSIQQSTKSADEKKQTEEEDSIADIGNVNNSKDSLQKITKSDNEEKETEEEDSVQDNGNGNNSTDTIQQTTKSDNEKKHIVEGDALPETGDGNNSTDFIQQTTKSAGEKKQIEEEDSVPATGNENHSTDSIQQTTKSSYEKKQTEEGEYVPENGNGDNSADSVQQTTKSDSEKKIDSSGKLKLVKKQTEEEDSVQENGNGSNSKDNIQQTTKSSYKRKQTEEEESVVDTGNKNYSTDSIQQTTKSSYENKQIVEGDSVLENGNGNNSKDTIQQDYRDIEDEIFNSFSVEQIRSNSSAGKTNIRNSRQRKREGKRRFGMSNTLFYLCLLSSIFILYFCISLTTIFYNKSREVSLPGISSMNSEKMHDPRSPSSNYFNSFINRKIEETDISTSHMIEKSTNDRHLETKKKKSWIKKFSFSKENKMETRFSIKILPQNDAFSIKYDLDINKESNPKIEARHFTYSEEILNYNLVGIVLLLFVTALCIITLSIRLFKEKGKIMDAVDSTHLTSSGTIKELNSVNNGTSSENDKLNTESEDKTQNTKEFIRNDNSQKSPEFIKPKDNTVDSEKETHNIEAEEEKMDTITAVEESKHLTSAGTAVDSNSKINGSSSENDKFNTESDDPTHSTNEFRRNGNSQKAPECIEPKDNTVVSEKETPNIEGEEEEKATITAAEEITDLTSAGTAKDSNSGINEASSENDKLNTESDDPTHSTNEFSRNDNSQKAPECIEPKDNTVDSEKETHSIEGEEEEKATITAAEESTDLTSAGTTKDSNSGINESSSENDKLNTESDDPKHSTNEFSRNDNSQKAPECIEPKDNTVVSEKETHNIEGEEEEKATINAVEESTDLTSAGTAKDSNSGINEASSENDKLNTESDDPTHSTNEFSRNDNSQKAPECIEPKDNTVDSEKETHSIEGEEEEKATITAAEESTDLTSAGTTKDSNSGINESSSENDKLNTESDDPKHSTNEFSRNDNSQKAPECIEPKDNTVDSEKETHSIEGEEEEKATITAAEESTDLTSAGTTKDSNSGINEASSENDKLNTESDDPTHSTNEFSRNDNSQKAPECIEPKDNTVDSEKETHSIEGEEEEKATITAAAESTDPTSAGTTKDSNFGINESSSENNKLNTESDDPTHSTNEFSRNDNSQKAPECIEPKDNTVDSEKETHSIEGEEEEKATITAAEESTDLTSAGTAKDSNSGINEASSENDKLNTESDDPTHSTNEFSRNDNSQKAPECIEPKDNTVDSEKETHSIEGEEEEKATITAAEESTDLTSAGTAKDSNSGSNEASAENDKLNTESDDPTHSTNEFSRNDNSQKAPECIEPKDNTMVSEKETHNIEGEEEEKATITAAEEITDLTSAGTAKDSNSGINEASSENDKRNTESDDPKHSTNEFSRNDNSQKAPECIEPKDNTVVSEKEAHSIEGEEEEKATITAAEESTDLTSAGTAKDSNSGINEASSENDKLNTESDDPINNNPIIKVNSSKMNNGCQNDKLNTESDDPTHSTNEFSRNDNSQKAPECIEPKDNTVDSEKETHSIEGEEEEKATITAAEESTDLTSAGTTKDSNSGINESSSENDTLNTESDDPKHSTNEFSRNDNSQKAPECIEPKDNTVDSEKETHSIEGEEEEKATITAAEESTDLTSAGTAKDSNSGINEASSENDKLNTESDDPKHRTNEFSRNDNSQKAPECIEPKDNTVDSEKETHSIEGEEEEKATITAAEESTDLTSAGTTKDSNSGINESSSENNKLNTESDDPTHSTNEFSRNDNSQKAPECIEPKDNTVDSEKETHSIEGEKATITAAEESTDLTSAGTTKDSNSGINEASSENDKLNTESDDPKHSTNEFSRNNNSQKAPECIEPKDNTVDSEKETHNIEGEEEEKATITAAEEITDLTSAGTTKNSNSGINEASSENDKLNTESDDPKHSTNEFIRNYNSQKAPECIEPKDNTVGSEKETHKIEGEEEEKATITAAEESTDLTSAGTAKDSNSGINEASSENDKLNTESDDPTHSTNEFSRNDNSQKAPECIEPKDNTMDSEKETHKIEAEGEKKDTITAVEESTHLTSAGTAIDLISRINDITVDIDKGTHGVESDEEKGKIITAEEITDQTIARIAKESNSIINGASAEMKNISKVSDPQKDFKINILDDPHQFGEFKNELKSAAYFKGESDSQETENKLENNSSGKLEISEIVTKRKFIERYVCLLAVLFIFYSCIMFPLLSFIIYNLDVPSTAISSINNRPNILHSSLRDQAGVSRTELGRTVTKEETILSTEKFVTNISLQKNFYSRNSLLSESTCGLNDSLSESSEEALMEETELNADLTAEKVSIFKPLDKKSDYFAKEKKLNSLAELKKINMEKTSDDGKSYRIKQKEKASILSQEVCNILPSDVCSNTNDKNYSIENLSDSKECTKIVEDSTLTTNLSEIDGFETNYLQNESKGSNVKPEKIRFNSLDFVFNKILLFILIISSFFYSFIFVLCKYISRFRMKNPVDTFTTEAMASPSNLEIEFLLSNSAENIVATPKKEKIIEYKTKINKESVSGSANTHQEQNMQKIPKINLESRLYYQQEETIELKKEEKESAKYPTEKKKMCDGELNKTLTDQSSKINERVLNGQEKKEERRKKKFEKNNNKKKVENQRREDLEVLSKKPIVVHEQNDASNSENLKTQSDRKQEISSEFSREFGKLPAVLEHSVNDGTSAYGESNSTRSQMHDMIFLQQGDLRFRYIADRNSNFTIKFTTVEKSHAQNEDKYLRYKLKVKKNE
ncbi:uncharacterized protein LOC129978536 [Argiope bruennichi]|uniref:uncharacterized protein LOC129978536 n=1 Tax=Argiope bruennichi TaxID=94029 RepID=UPI0024943086|nr:uncharacterized protein LOC129978536 [Argiope bruennichi]XP_055946630.1 uncharacterized protein LOC129978536 [Argiope bruennichi]XP_055946639.1 uncharacterized protein LOC129978536 [Argiope bruennichi]